MTNERNFSRLKNIKVIPYDEENEGKRKCNVCLAFTGEGTEIDRKIGASHTDKLFKLTIGGGFETILCEDCLNELEEKIKKR